MTIEEAIAYAKLGLKGWFLLFIGVASFFIIILNLLIGILE